MRKNLLLIFLVAMFGTRNAFAALVDPDSVIHQVETSQDMSFGPKLKVLLALSGYYNTFGDQKKVEEVYNHIISLIPDAPTNELIANVGYITILTDSFDKSKDPNIRQKAQVLRSEVISRALSQPQDDKSQNKNMESFGAQPLTALLNQLGKAPEFKGLFLAAVKGFPQDPASQQTLYRANNLADVIEKNRFGFGPYDQRTTLHTNIDEAKKDLENLQFQAIKTTEDLKKITNLTKKVEKLNAKLEALNHTSKDCWVDTRVPLDDMAAKAFTCAVVSVALNEDFSSIEAFNLLDRIIDERPFSLFYKDCTDQDFKMDKRRDAVLKAEAAIVIGPSQFDCKIPDDLKTAKMASVGFGYPLGGMGSGEATSTNDNLSNSGATSGGGGIVGGPPAADDGKGCVSCGVGGGYPGSSFSTLNATFEFHDCDQYVKELRDINNDLKAQDNFNLCDSTDGQNLADCLDRAEAQASYLSDEKAIPLMAKVVGRKVTTPGVSHPEQSLERVIARFESFNSSLDPAKINEGVVVEREQMLSQIDAAFSQYVVSSWKKTNVEEKLQGFENSVGFADRISDPGLRNLLLIHIVERFSEQGNAKLKFSDPTLAKTDGDN
jgi:hypothetical protein